ncbi:MAG TPA: chemotaxis protein CheW [Anaeromyxobacter sp.]|nr:chemotaxis protein CheW [Anaeromyxobacter sp.]
MRTAAPAARASIRTPGDTLRPGEELVALRSAGWRLLVPMRAIERVLPAAMPAARPATGATAPVVAVGVDLVPVVFAAALVGEREVRLEARQQMVLLADGGRRALLWVDAVEDVVPHAPAPAPPGAGPDLVLEWSGADRPLAVLDVPRLLELAC